MITTLMPAMVRDLGGVEYTGWTFAIYETGSIIAGAATGRLATYWTVRTNMVAAAIIFALGCLATGLIAPSMPWLLAGRLISGFGSGGLDLALLCRSAALFSLRCRLAAAHGGALRGLGHFGLWRAASAG